MKAEFRIIGHKAGWFLIEYIGAPGAAFAKLLLLTMTGRTTPPLRCCSR